MEKHLTLVLMVVVAILLNQVDASVINKKKCPKVKPMENFDVKKMAGSWYSQMASRGVLTQGEKCFKTTFTNIESDHLQYIFESQQYNGTSLKSTVERTLDPNRPGVMIHQKEFNIKDIFGKMEKKLLNVESVTLYTDYTNIEFRYSCTELDHFWESDVDQYFYITSRNRSFDSFRQILSFIETAKELGFDLNESQIPNQQNCASEF